MKARNPLFAILGIVLVVALLIFAYSLGRSSHSSTAAGNAAAAPAHSANVPPTKTALPATAIAINGLFSATLTDSPSCSVSTDGLTIHLWEPESQGVYDNFTFTIFRFSGPGTFSASGLLIRQLDTWNTQSGSTITINGDRHSGSMNLTLTATSLDGTTSTITMKGPFVCDQSF